MEKSTIQSDQIIEICLLAGKLLLQNGAETYRVEDTMIRMAFAFELRRSQSFVIPTGIIFSIDGVEATRLIRITERFTDLQKVALVNNISRQISEGGLTAEEALSRLKEVESANYSYPIWLQITSAALASGCFLIMFLGSWGDFIPAVIAGGLGYSSVLYFHRLAEIKFFAEFLASFLIGIVSYLFVFSGIGSELDKIIIGSVMPLVPGLLITNAVRDLMAGHLIAGLAKGAEAFLTAFAIGTGIAIVFSIL
ncbi:threonine/serine exporter family protein [Ammoniphilus sp. 3BR4]|uniref:threonine/serine exporter family protein n=1 Tax=Ammoniphilus sp. 3BR4 TaxID=3158265 RepID=UPI003466A8DF